MSASPTPLESLGLRPVDGPFGTTWHPGSDQALRDALLEGAASGTPMAPLGAGSSVRGCRVRQAAGEAPATWVSTRSLIPSGSSGIIEYVPGDGTITAYAGTPWSDLRAAVHEGGHRLTPAIHGDATLGGVIAAGRSGLDRCAFGPLRHHVLGLRVMDGTGRIARSGGRLVKNVTGFDLHRVHTGAAGTLGVILEASLRLMPIPESETLIESEPLGTPAAAVRAALSVRSHPGISTRSLFTVGSSVVVQLAGRRAQVETERRRVLELLTPKTEIAGPDATDRCLELGSTAPAIRIQCRPSNVADIVELCVGANELHGLLRVEPDAALVDLAPDAVQHLHGDFWTQAAPAIREAGGLVELRMRTPKGASAFIDATPIPHTEWSARLLSAFDPGNVLRIPR